MKHSHLQTFNPNFSLGLRAHLRTLMFTPVIALSITCIACDEQDQTNAELNQTEALMSASDVAVEELDLNTLALSAEESGSALACTPELLMTRGRTHHADSDLNELDTDREDRREHNETHEGRTHQEREGGEHHMDGEGGERQGHEGHEGRQGRRGHRGDRGGLILLAYDIDQDGELSADEQASLSDDLVAGCEAQRARILEEFDTNGDGILSDEELTVAQETMEARREALHIAREEARTAREAELLLEFDVDGDGVLSAEERRAAHDAGHNHQDMAMAEFDIDGDGELSDEELSNLTMTVRGRVRSGERPHPEPETAE